MARLNTNTIASLTSLSQMRKVISPKQPRVEVDKRLRGLRRVTSAALVIVSMMAKITSIYLRTQNLATHSHFCQLSESLRKGLKLRMKRKIQLK
jgi:hypothetical protein